MGTNWKPFAQKQNRMGLIYTVLSNKEMKLIPI